jgi:hypothetical protein
LVPIVGVVAALGLCVFVLDHVEVGLVGRRLAVDLARSGAGSGGGSCLLFGESLCASAAWDVRGFALRVPRATRDHRAIEIDSVTQLVELVLCELARVTDAQIVERQVRECDALQLVDAEAERLDHPVDLAVLAFVDRDAEPRVLALAGEDFDVSGERDRAVVELDAVAELLDVIRRELAVHLHVIGLRHVARRREEAGGELAVVREKKDALRVEVEAADRLHGNGEIREVVHHGDAAPIVGDRRDAALGLVEEDVELVVCDDCLAVDLDLILIGVDLGAEHGHDLAVDLHPTGGDQFLCLATGRHARRSKIALQSYGRGHGSVLRAVWLVRRGRICIERCGCSVDVGVRHLGARHLG